MVSRDADFMFCHLGYRHIRLRSNTGEVLINSTLFVHVAVTNRKGGGVSSNLLHTYVTLLFVGYFCFG